MHAFVVNDRTVTKYIRLYGYCFPCVGVVRVGVNVLHDFSMHGIAAHGPNVRGKVSCPNTIHSLSLAEVDVLMYEALVCRVISVFEVCENGVVGCALVC